MGLSVIRTRDRRRSPRVELQVAVLVKWIEEDGSLQEESTKTEVVNAHGCLVGLKRYVLPETNVELINRASQEAHLGRVVAIRDRQPALEGVNKVAIELAEPDAGLWGPRYAGFAWWEWRFALPEN